MQKEDGCCQIMLLCKVNELKNNGLGRTFEVQVDYDFFESLSLRRVLIVLDDVVLNNFVW